jgi:hypothetical protein
MRRLTALLHTHNDGLRLGRCLETLYPCDGILIIDHGSSDQTLRVAREYGARFVASEDVSSLSGIFSTSSPQPAQEWFLCLDPRESVTEALAASLFEFKSESDAIQALSVLLREETGTGWNEHKSPQTRLVRADWSRWDSYLPAFDSSAEVLEGELLRFKFP